MTCDCPWGIAPEKSPRSENADCGYLLYPLLPPCSYLAAPSLYILTDQSIRRHARLVTTQEAYSWS